MNIKEILKPTISSYEKEVEEMLKLNDAIQKEKQEIKKLNDAIQEREQKIKNLAEKKSYLKIDDEYTIFKKNVVLSLNINYKECTNYESVQSDPHGRSDDYEYKDSSTVVLVDEIQLCFKKHKESLGYYDQNNFFIKIINRNEFFPNFKLSINLEIESAYSKIIKTSRVKFNKKELKLDKDFVKLISLIKRNKSPN